MPDQTSRPVIAYRWVVFATAAFYSVHMIVTSSYVEPGGPFRFLTNWALLLSFYAASRMLAYSELRVAHNADVIPSIAAVLNAMVVYLYWSIYLKDPALIQGDNPVAWWQNYYIHLAGPVLQWIDAFFIRRAFRRFLAAAAALVFLVLTYAAWVELFVGPMNTTPVGTVTSGYPYPFLNHMDLTARLTYYATVGSAALGLLGLFTAIAWGIRRLLPGNAPLS